MRPRGAGDYPEARICQCVIDFSHLKMQKCPVSGPNPCYSWGVDRMRMVVMPRQAGQLPDLSATPKFHA